MQKLNSAQFTQAMLEEWEGGMEKEALVGAQTIGRGLRYLASPVSKGVGALKESVKGQFTPTAKEIWKGRLGGAGAVGALGAAHGAATAEPGERGAGALRGAVKGGLLGLAGGQLATRAGQQQVKRVAQRQVHGLTGYVPRTQAQAARGVGRFGQGMTPAERATAFQQMMGEGKITPEMANAAARGLTSLPGIAKSLATGGVTGSRGEVLRSALKAQGATVPLTMAALGAPAVAAGVKGRDPGEVGEAVGSTLGYIAGTPVPIAGNIAGGAALGAVGRRIGSGIGRLAGVTPRGQ